MPTTSLSLADWAAAPLHRVAASAALTPSGALSPVGGIEAKAGAASRHSSVRALAVCSIQCWDSDSTTHAAGTPVGDHTAAGLPILKAANVGELAQAIVGRFGDEVYGPVVPLPQVLTLADADKRFDYRASSFHPFGWLDALVAQALSSPADPGQPGQDPPLGQLRKRQSKGYLHVLGTAGSGKTSWALNWVRHSQQAETGLLPRLAGWYFARRFGASGEGRAQEHDEISALQNLVSIARRQRDVLPGTRLLLSDTEVETYRRQRHLQRGADTTEEATLRERFAEALHELVAPGSALGAPSAKAPLVFLIDGGDEMWGASARDTRWTFPRILPTLDQLPEHVYIVLLSRPGAHMLGFEGRVPLLRYQFTREQVDSAIGGYLDQQAQALEALYPGNEASPLLRDATLQGHIANASDGAFGYAPLLMWQWHADRALDGRIELQAQRLREWLHHPGSLPDGVYGLRAQEFLDMQAQAGIRDPHMGLAEALALLTQLRWPLTQHDLIELLQPGDASAPRHQRHEKTKRLQTLLEYGAGWLSGVQHQDAPLQFGHQSLAEVALVAWRLDCLGRTLTSQAIVAEARALSARNAGEDDTEEESEGTTEASHASPPDAHPLLTAQKRQQADAWLHARLAGGLKHPAQPLRWADQQALQHKRPWLNRGQRQETSWAYDLVWGPLHALTAAAYLPPGEAAEEFRRLGQKARQLLIDAPYLQTAIRAQAEYARQGAQFPDAHALREAYIMADRIEGDDAIQPLRHRVESALLDWHSHITTGAAQVGGVLWNLFGADEQGKHHAEAWKASLDEPALITEMPGTPSAFARQIPAKLSAVTECGNWLVTSDGKTYTEVWDLRDGSHRAVVHRKVDWAVGYHLCVCTDGRMIGLGGTTGFKSDLLLLGWIHLYDGTTCLARYAGHINGVTALKLRQVANANGRGSHLALASASWDGTVGLLLRSPNEVLADACPSKSAAQVPNLGVLARYAVDRAGVYSLALEAVKDVRGNVTHWAVASGGCGGAVGLLMRSAVQVQSDAKCSSMDAPNVGKSAHYSGHRKWVLSVSLRIARDAQGAVAYFAIATGSWDRTVGLLRVEPREIDDDAERSDWSMPNSNRGRIARYCGHLEKVNSVDLAAALFRGLISHWAIASGSADGTTGLLVIPLDTLDRDLAESGHEFEMPNPGRLARHEGHTSEISCVALRAAINRRTQSRYWLLACGFEDGSIGLLTRTAERLESDKEKCSSISAEAKHGQLAMFGGHIQRVAFVHLLATDGAASKEMSWGLISISADSSVGLMPNLPTELLQDAERLNLGVVGRRTRHLARYPGHLKDVLSISLRATADAKQQLTQWAVASGSSDSTVGMQLRHTDEIVADALGYYMKPDRPHSTKLVRYEGHQKEVTNVALDIGLDEEGIPIYYALFSGSCDNTAGTLFRTVDEFREDALHGGDPNRAKPGLLARYTGHQHWIWSVAYPAATSACRETASLVFATGSRDGCVGLLLRTPQGVKQDVARSDWQLTEPNPGVLIKSSEYNYGVNCVDLNMHALCRWTLAFGCDDGTVGLVQALGNEKMGERTLGNMGPIWRFALHLDRVMSVALQPVTNAAGQIMQWEVATGSDDRRVGLIKIRHNDSFDNEALKGGFLAEQIIHIQTNRPQFVHISAAVDPLHQPQSRTSSSSGLHWLGGDAGVAFIWRSTPTTGLSVEFACPYYAEGFKAMDFAQAPDRVHYMVGGAVGNDVALLPLRLFDPASPDPE